MPPHIVVDAGKFLRITRILFRHAATAASTTIRRAATSFRGIYTRVASAEDENEVIESNGKSEIENGFVVENFAGTAVPPD